METFINLYRTKNLTETAQLLGITQPTVSYRIKELEEYFGQNLIITQNSRRVEFTKFAETIYPEILWIIDRLEYLVNLNNTTDYKNNIVISTGEIAGIYFLPTLTKNYRDKYPEVNVVININSSYNVIKSLREGRADIGFIASREFPELKELETSIKIEKLIPIDLVLITPKGHILGQREQITPEEIVMSKEKYISRSNTSAIQYEFNKILKNAGLSPNELNIIHNFENSSSVIASVIEGLGVSVVSWFQAYKFVKAGLIDYSNITTEVKSYLYCLDRWYGRYSSINRFIEATKLYLQTMPHGIYDMDKNKIT